MCLRSRVDLRSAVAIALGFGLIGAATLLWQAWTWVQLGQWPQITNADALYYSKLPSSFTTALAGLQQVIDWLLASSAVTGLWTIAAACFGVMVWSLIRAELEDGFEQRRRLDQRIRKASPETLDKWMSGEGDLDG